MNRRLKRALAASFSPPPPQRKTVFLRTPAPAGPLPGDLSLEPDPLSAEATWLLSCGVRFRRFGAGAV